MPELPEVETVKNVLKPIVINRRILSIDVLNARQVMPNPTTFKEGLEGETILDLSRKGKYLIFHLTNKKVMISHLRMEGKYFEFLENEENSKYARVVFHFDNNHKLCYDDSRTFGILKLSSEEEYLQDEMIAKLGPEPFDADFNEIYQKTRKIKTAVKTALLDQTLMTGLGNIYVDETLYMAHVHPHTPACLVTKDKYQEIVNDASIILKRAIECGGSTIKSYHPGKNIDGNFQTELKIYGKKGETCKECGHTFLFTKTNGRGTTFCPYCQHKLGRPLNVGLTGKIASGKSFALDFFKSRGALVISSDELVKKLYEEPSIANKISLMFKLKFPKENVDKKILRDYLLTHPEDQRKLERYIHPLVRKEIEKILSKAKEDIRIVEVPLLFKAHYEDMFDTLMIIDIDEQIQKERLEKRNPHLSELLLEINKNNMIEENKNKVEFLVSNNQNEEEFFAKLEEIFNILQSRLD